MAGEVGKTGDENPYPLAVNNLKFMRNMLVEERRRQVQVGVETREAGNSSGGLVGGEFLHLQAIIDAVDRAIKDEESLGPSFIESMLA